MFVAGNNRGVRGKHRAGPDDFARLGKRQVFFLHNFNNALEKQKRAVAFVNMVNGGFNAHRGQGFHAADTQYHFLADTVFAVTSVEFFGN